MFFAIGKAPWNMASKALRKTSQLASTSNGRAAASNCKWSQLIFKACIHQAALTWGGLFHWGVIRKAPQIKSKEGIWRQHSRILRSLIYTSLKCKSVIRYRTLILVLRSLIAHTAPMAAARGRPRGSVVRAWPRRHDSARLSHVGALVSGRPRPSYLGGRDVSRARSAQAAEQKGHREGSSGLERWSQAGETTLPCVLNLGFDGLRIMRGDPPSSFMSLAFAPRLHALLFVGNSKIVAVKIQISLVGTGNGLQLKSSFDQTNFWKRCRRSLGLATRT